MIAVLLITVTDDANPCITARGCFLFSLLSTGTRQMTWCVRMHWLLKWIDHTLRFCESDWGLL
jgi:hypothetical protein